MKLIDFLSISKESKNPVVIRYSIHVKSDLLFRDYVYKCRYGYKNVRDVIYNLEFKYLIREIKSINISGNTIYIILQDESDKLSIVNK